MNLNQFPNEVLCCIFDYLPWKERQRVSLVCRRWNAIINSEHFLHHQKLVLYNCSKAKFFYGVSDELLRRQKCIEFNANAMLDTEELLQIVRDTFGGGEAMVESLTLNMRSEHRTAFELILVWLPKLAHLRELKVSAIEGLSNGLVISSACLERANISFYHQNSLCVLDTPRLRTLHLTVRYRGEMELLKAVSAQLVELEVSFISKDHVAILFDCDFRSLRVLGIALKNDKYISYDSPTRAKSMGMDGPFTRTIGGLQSLSIIDMCCIFDLDFLQLFTPATSLNALTINNIKLVNEVHDFINSFRKLEYLNLDGCTTSNDEPKRLDLPGLRTLVLPHKHNPLFSITELQTLTTLYYSNAMKTKTNFIEKLAKAFANLQFLHVQNFDYELDSNAFVSLNLLSKLRVLTIKDMSVSCQVFANCKTVPHLERLVLDTIVTEVSILETIPSIFPSLQSCVLKNCFFYLIPKDKSGSYMEFEELRRQMPSCRVSTRTSTVFINQQHQ
ncbi:uncharacterized protein LOC118462891 [Anopheles albimanus]|uniref:F-box domain-containing protein n=1 Tax=Anopheles albimanus TaxID=7167 RepID=A0A182FVA1_ANOAL|nr:uncharacterized protein LOC118462891 [Anopheles albimanus]